MKINILISSLLFAATISYGQKVIFLHHSVGLGVYDEGLVADWFANYNLNNNTSYQVSEIGFPATPYPWDNNPYDYWNLWINNACDNSNLNIVCLDKLVEDYDVIILKHCFMSAQILADDGNPLVSSDIKTIANYKLQYRALRSLLDSYSNTKFIVWTGAPLHRLATYPAEAARVKEFADWVKNEWLIEDSNPHSNIFIFDFFNFVAEASPQPEFGQTNCLKYEYEISHSNLDSHPNSLANQTLGPIFSQFIVNTIEAGIIVADTDPPSVPLGLTVTSTSPTEVIFSWNASTDNVGVSDYRVYRDGSFLQSTTGTSYTDNSVSSCNEYSYSVSAIDVAGNESAQSVNLVVNNCTPDLTSTITLSPNVAHGVTIFEMIVRVTELNSVNTNGTITIHIPKDELWTLSDGYDPSLTNLGSTNLNNNDWSHSEDATIHIFTSSTSILAGEYSTFGIRISFDPGNSMGVNPITSQVVSGGGGEVQVSNNSDSERLDYFQN